MDEDLKIYVTDPDGAEHVLDAPPGWRVMEIIRDHGLPIKAECGGCCACATCHVYVAQEWRDRVPPAGEEELYMLDEAYDVRDESRLSCQLIMDASLDGLRVTIARNE